MCSNFEAEFSMKEGLVIFQIDTLIGRGDASSQRGMIRRRVGLIKSLI